MADYFFRLFPKHSGVKECRIKIASSDGLTETYDRVRALNPQHNVYVLNPAIENDKFSRAMRQNLKHNFKRKGAKK